MGNIINIKKLRETKGFSQEYMAYRLGVSQPTYCRIEKNVEMINLQNIRKIALILEMDVVEIIKSF